MRKLTVVLFAIWHLTSYSQTYFGLYIEPVGQISTINSSQPRISDSLSSINSPDVTLGFGLDVRLYIDRFNSIVLSPGFNRYSSLYTLENLQLFDIVHPALPEIRDQSQAATKIAYSHNRFNYVNFQAQYHRSISDKYKSVGVLFEAFGGLTYHYLVSQDAKIRTEGFALDESFVHTVTDQLFYVGRSHNVSVNLGASAIYEPASDWQIHGDLQTQLPLLSVNSDENRLNIYGVGFRVGIRRML